MRRSFLCTGSKTIIETRPMPNMSLIMICQRKKRDARTRFLHFGRDGVGLFQEGLVTFSVYMGWIVVDGET